MANMLFNKFWKKLDVKLGNPGVLNGGNVISGKLRTISFDCVVVFIVAAKLDDVADKEFETVGKVNKLFGLPVFL
jgi:hypothetical protein